LIFTNKTVYTSYR